MHVRKIALCVEAWWSEENHFAWNFTRKRLLQEGSSSDFTDRIYVVHVAPKGKEIENWDKGTPVLGDVQTELAGYDHCITELQGDVVNSIVHFVALEGIHIVILSLKDQNPVKKTLSMGTAQQILARASCACTIVSPRFSAGDQFRIQAKLQPDKLVANSAMEFRRRVAVVLNSTLWDSALTQYVAKNVILPGDRVILARYLNENLNKRNAEELQLERDYLRELGWHQFKRKNVTLAVEVLKSHTRVLIDLLEEKGVDLLVMTRSDSNKLKRSIKKENVSFQSFPHKCPCPFMIVPTEVLKGFCRHPPSCQTEAEPISPFASSPRTPLGIFNLKTWSSGIRTSPLKLFGARRCQSIDTADPSQELRNTEYLGRDESIELSSNPVPDAEAKVLQPSWKSLDKPTSSTLADPERNELPAIVTAEDEDTQKEAVMRRLQKKLYEKEKEVLYLKQRIHHLQSI